MNDTKKIEMLMDVLRDLANNIDVSTIRPVSATRNGGGKLNTEARQILAACGDQEAKDLLDAWGDEETICEACGEDNDTCDCVTE